MKFTKYNHKIQEKKIYNFWEKNNLFKPSSKKKKKNFFNFYTSTKCYRKTPYGERS